MTSTPAPSPAPPSTGPGAQAPASTPPEPGDAPLVLTVRTARRAATGFLRRYHRLDVTVGGPLHDGPVLFVTNHGFGGAADLNVLAALAALDELSLTRDVTILCHQIAWTLGLGKVVEAGGARPATYASAAEAFRLGRHVLVAPGGDIDAAKSFAARNRIAFSGRRGFARLAVEQGVPVVTAGAGESLLVLWDGQGLARALRLDTALRLKVVPVSLSLPWGFSVGVAGLLPYLPLPSKLVTSVLDPMSPEEGEPPEAFGDRVEATMQAGLTAMTAHRRLLLG